MAQKDMEKNSQKSLIDIRSSLIRFSGESVDGKCSYGRFCVFEAIFAPKTVNTHKDPKDCPNLPGKKFPKISHWY
jgi:hypothetical protein